MTNELSGRTALVTGSVGSGIGRSSALALAARGADVVLNYGTGRRGADMARAAVVLQDVIAGMGQRSLVVPADCTDPGDVDQMVQTIESTIGPVQILVINVGAPWLAQDFPDADPQRWRRTLAAEVEAPAYLIRRTLPAMRAERWGRIVALGVDARVLGALIDTTYGNSLERYPYPFDVAKAARRRMVETLAYSELKYGVTVNLVEPGIIEETSLAEALDNARDNGHRSAPWAGPSDVAEAVAYLCSDAARFITNSVLRMPGNLYTRLP